MQDRAGYHHQPGDEAMHAWLLSKVGCPDPDGIVALTAIDVAVSAFDARRKGNRGSARSLLDARLKEVCRRHRRAREAYAAIHRRSR